MTEVVGQRGVASVPSLRRHDQRVALLMPGTLAVALMLFGTRWASYFGKDPVFLTDLLVLLAVLGSLVSAALSARSPSATRQPFPDAITLLSLALFGYSAIGVVAGLSYGQTAFRDAAPYIYVVVGLVAARGARTSTEGQIRRTVRLLFVCLVLHALWFVTSVLVAPDLPNSMPALSPDGSVRILSVRSDVDSAYAGVLVALLIYGGLRRGSGWAFRILVSVPTLLAIFASGSRAGLLGAATAVIWVLSASTRSTWMGTRSRRRVFAAGAILIVGVVLVAPATIVGQRFISTFVSSSQTPGVVSGAGTARAREAAWPLLLNYDASSAQRLLFGAGPGPDFMAESGAELALVGEGTAGTARSPHNYWLGTLSRIGLLGLCIVVAIVSITGFRAIQTRAQLASNAITVVAPALFFSLLIPASLGVVLESPFGAVPFFWAVGVIAGHRLRPQEVGSI